MTEIKLEKRYPHSRVEDITDAFMRGYEQGVKDALRDINKTLERSLHEQVKSMMGADQSEPFDKDINVRSKDEPQTDREGE